MSINFNKLFIQDILKRRGSHTLDLGEGNEETEKYECEYVSDEADYTGSDNAEEMCGQTMKENRVVAQATNLPTAGQSQKSRLLAAIRDLHAAIEKQTVLRKQLAQRSGLDYDDMSSSLDNRKYRVSDQVTGSGVMTEEEHRPSIEELTKLTINEDKAVGAELKVKSKKKRIPSLSNSVDSVPHANQPSNDLLSFKRCERLSKKKEQVVVEVRVVFLKIGEIDTLKEIYHADAFIQAKWREPRLDGKSEEELRKIDLQRCWNPLILIDNILNESKDQHWINTHTGDNNEIYIVERRRLRGIFLETLELNDFPLDVQDLTITLTSERPDTEVALVPDKNELCAINVQTLVDQQEWRLHEHIEVTRRSATQEYTNSSQHHPCISVTCRAARRPGYFYWNVFLIMFFITGLSFATFAVPPERPENRLQLSFTLFLTSVAFKFVINQSLPKISYLTYMDKYVLMSLAILCVVSIWHAVVTLIPTDEWKPVSVRSETTTAIGEQNPSDITAGLANPLTFTPLLLIRQSMNMSDKPMEGKKVRDTINVTRLNRTHIADEFGAINTTISKFKLGPIDWQALAKQTTQDAKTQRRLKLRIEQEVFASFCVLYILAHLTFIFWLYFDASARRREMVELDRQYKRWLHANKEAQAQAQAQQNC
ncbi:hypothetical protein CRM22_007218 [Opisthorchis felineus]|uniref:Neurotransmitter-gated ion-channel ligand-binding domain-containing protein n=1 Tax=Opisthorchis felineus TaxID=147828 RepID=A0A4S2LIX3_OPIFE|nr:hypothetical protein CRM22_007218 [Opisthorchis felineus]